MASPHRHKVDLKKTNFSLNVDMDSQKLKKKQKTQIKKNHHIVKYEN